MAGEKRERTHRRLIEAAFEVVAERGFHGANVDLIARHAGLSTGALYAHFKSKDALLLAAFEKHLRWFGESLEAAVDAADLSGAIAAWIRALGDEREQFLIFVEFWAYAVRHEELRSELTGRLDGMLDALAGGIERRAHADGAELPLPPALTAQVALALARGLAFEVVTDPKRTPDTAFADLLAGFVSPKP